MDNNYILHDMNKSWQPPENFKFVSLTPSGSYLVVRFSQTLFKPETMTILGRDVADIYLNDMGREVSRVTYREYLPEPVPSLPKPMPVARRFRIWNGFLLALHGLREMFR